MSKLACLTGGLLTTSQTSLGKRGRERTAMAMNVTIWPFQKQPPKCIITVDLSDKNATVMENAWF